jgi:hypothetical protein
MFRDEYAIDIPFEVAPATWSVAAPAVVRERAPREVARLDLFAYDEVGAVAHVYREIAQRIARKSFTTHASTLGDALR